MRTVENILPVLLVLLAGCSGMMDDLAPSGSDKRSSLQCGTTGPGVCQIAPDFTLPDTLGSSVTLSSVVTTTGARGAVLYFTMWCPVCDTHMSNMQAAILPVHPDVRFFLVDYVSGSVADAANAQLINGYAGSGFTVLADMNQTALNLYQATMGSTVVIDKTGVIRMNEDYKDGSRLQAALAALP